MRKSLPNARGRRNATVGLLVLGAALAACSTAPAPGEHHSVDGTAGDPAPTTTAQLHETAAQAVTTNFVTDETLLAHLASPDATANPVIQRFDPTSPPSATPWHLYTEGADRKVYLSRVDALTAAEFSAQPRTLLTPDVHSFAGKCQGLQNDAWNLGGHLYYGGESSGTGQDTVLLAMSHYCSKGTESGMAGRRFFHVETGYDGSLLSGATAQPFLDLSDLDEATVVGDPSPFRLSHDPLDQGAFGFLFNYQVAGVTYLGYGFHDRGAGTTTVLGWNGAGKRTNPNRWTWETVDANWKPADNVRLGAINNGNIGSVSEAITRVTPADDEIDEADGRVWVLGSTPEPVGGCNDRFKLSEFRFFGKGHPNAFQIDGDGVIEEEIYRYKSIGRTSSTCEGTGLCASQPAISKANRDGDLEFLSDLSTQLLWMEDAQTPCGEADTIVSGSATLPFPSYRRSNLGVSVKGLQSENSLAASIATADALLAMDVDSVEINAGWKATEPQDDVYDWDLMDKLFPPFLDRGFRVSASITSTPEWANGVPDSTIGPTDQGDYTDFVRALLDRYPGITEVSVWNEPNFNFWGSPYPEYLQLLKRTIDDLAVSHPEVEVVGPGLGVNKYISHVPARPSPPRPRPDAWEHILQTLDFFEDNSMPIENFAIHVYLHDPDNAEEGEFQDSGEYIELVAQELRDRGLDPQDVLRIDEINHGFALPYACDVYTYETDEWRGDMVYELITPLVANTKSIFWFLSHDAAFTCDLTGQTLPMGLLDEDDNYSERYAATMFRLARAHAQSPYYQ